MRCVNLQGTSCMYVETMLKQFHAKVTLWRKSDK